MSGITLNGLAPTTTPDEPVITSTPFGSLSFSGLNDSTTYTLTITDTPGEPGGSFVAAAGTNYADAETASLSTITITDTGANLTADMQALEFGLAEPWEEQGASALTFELTSPSSQNLGSEQVSCFVAGTRIATPEGWTPVECLRPGDFIVTADGRIESVRWIGVQTVAPRFADPVRALPIRIRAGALGENTPSHDLLLSPGHGVVLDGVIVHAGALVNGTSIVRETNMPERFEYYNVELASHDVLLANAAPAESYLPAVESAVFDNAASRPDREAPAEMAYPRAKAFRQVPSALRVRLAASAMRLALAVERAA